MPSIRSAAIGFTIGAGTVGALLSATAQLSGYHLFFDLLSHFRVQYVALIAAPLALALVARKYLSAIILTSCVSLHIAVIAESQRLVDSEKRVDGPVVRVMSSNLLATNGEHGEQIKYIKEIDPDVIVFQEYTRAWARALSQSLSNYIYKVEIPKEGPFGIALYSKVPFVNDKSNEGKRIARSYVDRRLIKDDGELRVIGIHPPPPISNDLYVERNYELKALAEIASDRTGPLIILGDLNTSPWSNTFRSLLEEGRLRDSRSGFGILATWPENASLLRIPIDHVITDSNARVTQWEQVKDSDQIIGLYGRTFKSSRLRDQDYMVKADKCVESVA